MPGHGRHGMFGIKTWLSTLGTESGNHINVDTASVWDVKEPLRTTSIVAMTTLSIGRLGVNGLKKAD